jgi:hypothetical protein
MADTDDTSDPQPTPNRDLPIAPPAQDVSAETPSVLEQTIDTERRKLMQVHSLLHCLYEVLLYADGEDAIPYAQAAPLGAELLDDSVARLDSSRIKPMIEAARRAPFVY